MTDKKAVSTPISLYPTQRAIAEAFAEETGRNLSNAIQFIIEDWARITGFQDKLQADQHAATTKKTRRGKSDPSKVRGVHKGMVAISEAA